MEINSIDDYIKVITEFHLKSVQDFFNSISSVLTAMNKEIMLIRSEVKDLKYVATTSSSKS